MATAGSIPTTPIHILTVYLLDVAASDAEDSAMDQPAAKKKGKTAAKCAIGVFQLYRKDRN